MGIKHLQNLIGDKLHTVPLLVLYLTDGCNSRCVTCDIWRNPRRNMDMALVDSLVDAVQALGVRWILLSGGEVMQHPHWAEIAQRFRQVGVYVMMLTNGLLVRKQATQIIESVDELIVSLDGATPETYAAIRGVDALPRILDGISAVRAAGVRVITRTTLQRGNLHEFLALLSLGVSLDVSAMSFLTVDVSNEWAFGARQDIDPQLVILPVNSPPSVSYAPTLAQVEQFERDIDTAAIQHAPLFATQRIAESVDKLHRMARYFKGLHGVTHFEPPRCNAPHISTVIEVDGTVRPCYFLPDYGKLGAQTLLEVLNSDAGLALRRAYRTGQRAECERCVCPLYKGVRALAKM